MAKFLIELGADPNIKCTYINETLLHAVVRSGKFNPKLVFFK